jgi:hypothetical protein
MPLSSEHWRGSHKNVTFNWAAKATLPAATWQGAFEQHPDRLAAAVMGVAQVTQKGLEVRRARVGPAQQQALAVAHIERPEKHPLGVMAAEGHFGLLATRRPGRPQRR